MFDNIDTIIIEMQIYIYIYKLLNLYVIYWLH